MSDKTIAPIVSLLKSFPSVSLKTKRMIENPIERAREIKRPAEAVLFDSFLFSLRYATLLDTIRGSPLAIKVSMTEKMLIAI